MKILYLLHSMVTEIQECTWTILPTSPLSSLPLPSQFPSHGAISHHRRSATRWDSRRGTLRMRSIYDRNAKVLLLAPLLRLEQSTDPAPAPALWED
jgi:hypothetical protein